jgi:hypothetical protein
MKYKVVISAMNIDGEIKRRGDIVEMSEQEFLKCGTRLEPFVEPAKPKRRGRPKKVESED